MRRRTKRDVAFPAEQAGSRVHADPARAGDVNFGPGMKIGEIDLCAFRAVQRFNVGAQLLVDHADPGWPADPLIELMETIAARDYGWIAPVATSAGRNRGELSESGLRRELAGNGFRIRQVCEFQYAHSLEDRRAWLSVPIFTLRQFAALPYQRRLAILNEAYRRLTASGGHCEPVLVPWIAIAADLGNPR